MEFGINAKIQNIWKHNDQKLNGQHKEQKLNLANIQGPKTILRLNRRKQMFSHKLSTCCDNFNVE